MAVSMPAEQRRAAHAVTQLDQIVTEILTLSDALAMAARATLSVRRPANPTGRRGRSVN
jgi:hypothetical protein